MSSRFAIDKYLVLNDLRFHYRDWNGRGWPVLLLHGLASTSHIWDLVAPLLSETARVAALDLRGHGLSDKPDGSYSFETTGGDVAGVIEALGFEKPVLVGHSWGAAVALWLAAHRPELAGGLVMVDGGLLDFEGLSWEQTEAHLTPPRLDGMPVDEFRERLLEGAPQGLISPAVEAAILANFEIDVENRIRRRLPLEYHLRILRSLWQLRLAPLYERAACPALALPARRRDSEEPEWLARKERGAALMVEKMADVEVVWLENTIHDVPLQRPHRLAEEINRFLQEQL
jgi:pimeloyl-ACP methyl ester carboxylesterase